MTQLKDSMSNIEKIRQEIEFLKELNEGLYTEGDNSYYEGHDNACNHILAFIDSLPDETCKDSLQVPETCKENADSFTSLEEAAKEYAYSWRKEGNKEVRELFPKAAYRVFIAGAEWQAKQGYSLEYIIRYAWGVSDTSTESKKATLSFPLPADIFEGDRVIIQIRKR